MFDVIHELSGHLLLDYWTTTEGKKNVDNFGRPRRPWLHKIWAPLYTRKDAYFITIFLRDLHKIQAKPTKLNSRAAGCDFGTNFPLFWLLLEI